MSKTITRSITYPADWQTAIDELAANAGVKPTEWIRNAIRDKMPSRIAKELSEPRPAHRPREDVTP